MGKSIFGTCAAALVLLTTLALPAVAEVPMVELVIKNHKFEPAHVTIPARTKVKLHIRNLDATAEEFESYDLNREKIVPPNGQIFVFVGPLAPGQYKFFGEFHMDTAQGVLVVE